MALVIGNSGYQHVSNLPNPKNDATDMAVTLERLGGDLLVLGPAELEQPAPIPLPVGVRDSAEDLVLFDHFEGVPVARLAAALVADLKQLAGLAGGEHHSPGIRERAGHLLLAVDVLASLETGDGVLGVHPVGRGDNHRDEVALLVEHLIRAIFALDEPRVCRSHMHGQILDEALKVLGFGHEVRFTTHFYEDTNFSAGMDVRLGDADTAILWYRPEDAETYRMIYGDLSVADVAPENLPQ